MTTQPPPKAGDLLLFYSSYCIGLDLGIDDDTDISVYEAKAQKLAELPKSTLRTTFQSITGKSIPEYSFYTNILGFPKNMSKEDFEYLERTYMEAVILRFEIFGLTDNAGVYIINSDTNQDSVTLEEEVPFVELKKVNQNKLN